MRLLVNRGIIEVDIVYDYQIRESISYEKCITILQLLIDLYRVFYASYYNA